MIDKWLNKVDRLDSNLFYWCIIATSILLAAWMQTIQHGWINPDSVLYLEQARLFTVKDWQGILAVYEWPLYGVCIGFVHQLTQLPIHTSAQLLNMVFFGAATASFLQLIKLAGGNNRTWFFAAFLLFSSQYIVGDILEMLMRDEGFWVFYLTALVFFIRFINQHKITDAILWQVCIITATLFRVEAILFLLFLPLLCLLKQPEMTVKQSLQRLTMAYCISLLLGVIIALVLLTQPQLSMSHFGRLDEVFSSNLYTEFTKLLFLKADIMSTQVLGRYLDEFAIPGLLLTFAYVIGSKILSSTGLIGVGLAIAHFKEGFKDMPSYIKHVLLAASFIALLSASLIIIKVFVLSSRYVIALAWLLLIFASFYLAALSARTNKKSRIILLTLCLILSLGFIKNILPKRQGYNYSQHAVTWIKRHNKHNEPVFYNESRMRYYAKQAFQGGSANPLKILSDAVDNQSIDQYRYLLVYSSKKEAEKLKLVTDKIPEYKLIKTFNNTKHKKYVLIFKKR